MAKNVLADLLRWMLGLQSTDELIRKLKQHPNLAGAANFKPREIPIFWTGLTS